MDYKISIAGIVEIEETHVMGFSNTVPINSVKEKYLENLKRLEKLLVGVEEIGFNISIIKSYNPLEKNMEVVFGVAAELAEAANNILQEKNGVWAILPPHPTVLKIKLSGERLHLKEAWDKSFTFIADNKLIVDTYANPWEVYISNLETEIYIPLIITKDKDLEKLAVKF
ncbi:MAG: hypothetical protein FWE18_04180 [Alphaproteobacteria bacterium]|nr:hypothetical protein [Alphaproteobacteria bacterium]